MDVPFVSLFSSQRSPEKEVTLYGTNIVSEFIIKGLGTETYSPVYLTFDLSVHGDWLLLRLFFLGPPSSLISKMMSRLELVNSGRNSD